MAYKCHAFYVIINKKFAKKKEGFDVGKESRQRNKGIILIVCAGFFFSLMTFFVKLSGDLPTMQKAFFRNAVAVVVAGIMLIKSKESFAIKKGCRFSMLMRCACGTAGLICNFYAIDHIHIADANMLNKLSPFFAIIFSGFILHEKANKIEWSAVILAFIGALFIMKPSFNIFFLYAVIGVLGGLGAGVAYTFVRDMGKKGQSGTVIVIYFALFSCITIFPFLIVQYKPMSLIQFSCLMLAGVAATGGQFCITAAYTKAPAREISVFDYTQVIFAALLGILFLSEVPDGFSVLGYFIIIGTAIAKWEYNRRIDVKKEQVV